MGTRLESIQDLVDDMRRLMLDQTQPYRYDDTSLIVGLNVALQEVRRLRPDLIVCRYGVHLPQYDAPSGEDIPIEHQFRLPLVYGAISHTLLRDEEDVQDQRASIMRQMFEDMLIGKRESPIKAGTPSPQAPKG